VVDIRDNDVRRYDVKRDFIIIVRLIFSLRGIMLVQIAKRYGKIIYQLVKQLVLIEQDGVHLIDNNQNPDPSHQSPDGVALVRHQVQDGVVVLSGLDRLLRGDEEVESCVRSRAVLGGVHAGRVLHNLYRRKRRKKKIYMARVLLLI